MNKIITGSTDTQEQAISSPQSIISLKLPLNIANPTGKVNNELLFVTIKGHIKLFQTEIKENIAIVIIAGIDNGRKIWVKIWYIELPSILAANSNSLGKDKKYCRIRKIENPEIIPGKINAQ